MLSYICTCMKRILFTFLATLFLINTIGINVYAHFCAGVLAETSLVVPVSGCCELPEENKDCCESEHTYLQLDEEFISLKNSISVENSMLASASIKTTFTSTIRESLTTWNDVEENLPSTPIFLLNQVFII